MDAIRQLRGRSAGIRAWAVWELPGWLIAFILLVVLADIAVIAVEASRVSIHLHDLALFGTALVCIVATVELTRRAGENAGSVKDVFAVWELPVAMLLPLVYAPIAPIVRFALVQWRVRQVALYKRIFSAAAIGLSYVAAGLVFHASHPAAAWPGR